MERRVLIIEKDNDIRQVISYLLAEAGYQTLRTASDKEALKIIKKEKPDVIILDVVNPHHDADLCRAIKDSKDINHIPLIVLSTHSKIEIMKEICADEVIPKPFDILNFIEIIERQFAT